MVGTDHGRTGRGVPGAGTADLGGTGLKPHLIKTFKLSTDPNFDEKLIDVCRLYLNPPNNAIDFCMDEKTSIQALDRSQPSLPMVRGRSETVTHDYKRNETATLFAAFEVTTGRFWDPASPSTVTMNSWGF